MSQMMFSKVIEVLKEFGGYFTFSDDEGVEYVVIPKDDFDDLRESVEEIQLALPEAEDYDECECEECDECDHEECDCDDDKVESADDVLDRINQDIALFKLAQEEQETADDLDITEDEMAEYEEEEKAEEATQEPTIEHIESNPNQQTEHTQNDMEPPRRVRFEPIHGDLPPELQE